MVDGMNQAAERPGFNAAGATALARQLKATVPWRGPGSARFPYFTGAERLVCRPRPPGAPDGGLRGLGLPDMAGAGVGRTLRAGQPGLLIIILTARSDEMDVVVGLDAGADDYLVKPFNLTVLLARLRAHLRRRPEGTDDTDPIRVGDLVVDTSARRCLLGGREIDLRSKEFEPLVALASHPVVSFPRVDLFPQVWF